MRTTLVTALLAATTFEALAASPCANVTETRLPTRPPLRVACVGDSITAGTCSTIGGYPAILQGELGAGYHVANFGVHGATVQRVGHCRSGDKVGSCSFWGSRDLAQAFAFLPDIVILQFGTNDAKARRRRVDRMGRRRHAAVPLACPCGWGGAVA